MEDPVWHPNIVNHLRNLVGKTDQNRTRRGRIDKAPRLSHIDMSLSNTWIQLPTYARRSVICATDLLRKRWELSSSLRARMKTAITGHRRMRVPRRTQDICEAMYMKSREVEPSRITGERREDGDIRLT